MVPLRGPISLFWFHFSFLLPILFSHHAALIDGLIVCSITFPQYPTLLNLSPPTSTHSFQTTARSSSARLQEVLSAHVCGHGKDCDSNHRGSGARVRVRIRQEFRFQSPWFQCSCARGVILEIELLEQHHYT